MNTIKSINEYNTYLVENQQQITIVDYVKEINKIDFNIDISFIDEFIELVSKNECCIHHNMLQKYDIITMKGTTNDIKKMLEQYEMIEYKDFDLRNVSQVRPQGGTVIKNEYYLHPRAFKICLMRSLKTKKYAKYYLLLEECIKYYNDYQVELNKKYIIKLKYKIDKKDNKIDKLEVKVNQLLEDNKTTHKMNEELLNRSKKLELQLNETLERLDITNDKLDDTNEELELTNEKLDNTDKTLNKVAKKLDIAVEDRVINTKKKATTEYFIIMKNKSETYKYYVIRGQLRYINKKKEHLKGYTEIKMIECCPNANILWNLIKEKLSDNIDCCGNKLNIVDISQHDFLLKVDELYNQRKNIIL